MNKLSTAALLVALGFGGSCGPGLEPPKSSSAGDVDHNPPTIPGVGVGAAGSAAAAGRGGTSFGHGGSGGGAAAGGTAGHAASDGGVDDAGE